MVVIAKTPNSDFVLTAYDNTRSAANKKRSTADATHFDQRITEELNGTLVSTDSTSADKDKDISSNTQEGKLSIKKSQNTETITDTATATAESLGVKVAIINDATREFKGAFNPKTGEVEINTAFATSEADVQQTVVHEVIGHGGIQAIAGCCFGEK